MEETGQRSKLRVRATNCSLILCNSLTVWNDGQVGSILKGSTCTSFPVIMSHDCALNSMHNVTDFVIMCVEYVKIDITLFKSHRTLTQSHAL